MINSVIDYCLQQDLQLTLERGRCPQFYADMINMDSRAMNVVALALSILFQQCSTLIL